MAGERGSPDTWRDPLKFQHFIRSQKRRADNNLRDHDMQWDFWTLSPGVGASGDLADGRPRHPAQLAAHERVQLAHLPPHLPASPVPPTVRDREDTEQAIVGKVVELLSARPHDRFLAGPKKWPGWPGPAGRHR